MDNTAEPQPGNTALAALLASAGLSNAKLARAIVTAGANEGLHLGTNPTAVRRMLDGAQPRWPVPRLVAVVLSRQLQREVTIADCGFEDRSPIVQDTFDGLRWQGSLDGTVRTVIELSGRDMNRRSFLLGSAFAAGAFSEPALFAMTLPPAKNTSRVGGRRVGMADVEVLAETVAHYRQLDHRFGAGRVRDQVVQSLHRELHAVKHGTYSERTGRALLSTVAQLSWLAGSMAADVGRHALAQNYYVQTLNMAMEAGDRPYAANVLSHMSRLTVQIGHGARTEADRVRHAQHAIALARAGRSVSDGHDTPALAALLHAVKARGHALLGDTSATHASVREAEQRYTRSRPGEEPPWLAFYTEAELHADLGRCLRDTGDPEQGLRLITNALTTYEPWRTRSRCFVQTDLATAHLVANDHDRAADLGLQAIDTATKVSSTRTIDRIRTLHQNVHPLRARSRTLADFDDHLTVFLAESRTPKDA